MGKSGLPLLLVALILTGCATSSANRLWLNRDYQGLSQIGSEEFKQLGVMDLTFVCEGKLKMQKYTEFDQCIAVLKERLKTERSGNIAITFTYESSMAMVSSKENGADSRWQVDIAANPPRAKIGKDAFTLTVTSSQKGYLYLIYVGSDQKEFLQLYPEGNEPNVIEARRPQRIPGEFAAGGPAGTNHVLAIVSKESRDFSSILGKGSASATLANAAALQETACATRNLKRRKCQPGDSESPAGTRNLKLVSTPEGESDTYGAATLELIEW